MITGRFLRYAHIRQNCALYLVHSTGLLHPKTAALDVVSHARPEFLLEDGNFPNRLYLMLRDPRGEPAGFVVRFFTAVLYLCVYRSSTVEWFRFWRSGATAGELEPVPELCKIQQTGRRFHWKPAAIEFRTD